MVRLTETRLAGNRAECRVIALVPHPGEAAIYFEPGETGLVDRLLGDGDRLAHGRRSVPVDTRSAHTWRLPSNAMPEQARQPVPVRTILATIGLVLATLIVVKLSILLFRIEILLVVAAFFATVLNPPVEFVMRRLHVRRGLAIANCCA